MADTKRILITALIIIAFLLAAGLLIVYKYWQAEKQANLNDALDTKEADILACIDQSNEIMEEFQYVTVKIGGNKDGISCSRLGRLREEYAFLRGRCQPVLQEYEALVEQSRGVYAAGQADASISRAKEAQSNFKANLRYMDRTLTECSKQRF